MSASRPLLGASFGGGGKLRKGRHGTARGGAISTISPGYPQLVFAPASLDGAARAGPRARGEKVVGLAHPVKSEGPRGSHNDRPPSPCPDGGAFRAGCPQLVHGRVHRQSRPLDRAIVSLRGRGEARQGVPGAGAADGQALTFRKAQGYNRTCRFWRRQRLITPEAPSGVASEHFGGVRKEHEKNVPAEAPPSPTGPRVSPEDVHAWRAEGVEAPAGQGPGPLDRALSGRRWGPGLYRLVVRRDFDRVFRSGRRGASHLVTAWAAPGPCAGVRVGFAVGRRVGKAVTRNRVRRRLREALRLELEGVRPGTDVVLSARPGCRDAEFSELREALRTALKRAGAWVGSA